MPEEVLKDLIATYLYATSVADDDENIDIVFGNRFWDEYVKGIPTEKLKSLSTDDLGIPLTLRLSRGKEPEVRQYNFQA